MLAFYALYIIGGVGRGSFNDLTRSHLLWLLSIGYLVTSLIRTAMLDWSQLFLIQECNQSKIIGNICLEYYLILLFIFQHEKLFLNFIM